MNALTITAKSSICLIIGDPVSQSLSPVMHNAGYAALGLPFVMAAARVTEETLADAVRGVRALGIRGLAVTMPHKVTLLGMVDELDPVAKEIGAINTVVNQDGKLEGFNTDWLGIAAPLEQKTSLRGLKVAILGAGGAAQAAAFATTNRGAKVTVFNRSAERAASCAERWGCLIRDIADHEQIADYDVVINTTPVGMANSINDTPIPASVLRRGQIIFDTIYQPFATRLIEEAEERGCIAIRGADMFLSQGLPQFEYHTRTPAPRDDMERALRRSLEGLS
jgi:shikimate dehydrogenase